MFGIFAGLVAAEMYVRIARPLPPRQLVRGHGLRSLDGVPVWEVSGDRQNRTCVEQHPERTRILFFGSSITYGSDLSAAQTFTTALDARLNDARPSPGFCVLNFAQPGFSFEQKYAIARVEVDRYRPTLIMWEDWLEWYDYTMIGNAAYGTLEFVVRPDGFIGLPGVPNVLNRLLFRHSRFYEYLTLMHGERAPRRSEPEEAKVFADTRLFKVLQLAQSVGAKLAFYLAPPLDRPFADSAAELPPWHGPLLEFAAARGIPVYALQRELIDQDHLVLRMDPCCHYSAAGHRALASVMERMVLEQLDGAQRGA